MIKSILNFFRKNKDNKINLKYIESLSPCKDRLDNYKVYHKDFSGSLSTFLDLDNVTHSDKLWVYFRSIPVKTIPLVAADFAERVLEVYEKAYPGDNRPKLAIEAARDPNVTKSAAESARSAWSVWAAWAAAESAAWSARSAARSAEYAAWSAAADAAWSARSAEYAAESARSAADAAESAAWSMWRSAARSAESARSAADEELEQIKIMKRYL